VNTHQRVRLPGFTAESSVMIAGPLGAYDSLWSVSGTGVVSAGSDVTCNCGCPCSGSTGGGGGGGGSSNPGVCQCSSVLGIGCSVSSNSCNPGFVPSCNCGVTGNSCQCVPGGT
jgi:hypothetical protein